MDQRGLVERARRGDHDAFAELARAAVVRLDQAARLILRDPELARDAVQEGLIRAWRDLPELRDPDRFDAWLHRLTVNACLDLDASPAPATDRGRARRRSTRRPSTDRPARSPIATWSKRCSGASTSEGRAIVVLHYFLGMPLTEVAATLGIPIGTVKSRLHRALGDMRVAIDADSDASRRRRSRRAARMTTDVASSATCPTILGEIAMGPYPDYIDDVLATTAQRRQRPRLDVPRKVAPSEPRE